MTSLAPPRSEIDPALLGNGKEIAPRTVVTLGELIDERGDAGGILCDYLLSFRVRHI